MLPYPVASRVVFTQHLSNPQRPYMYTCIHFLGVLLWDCCMCNTHCVSCVHYAEKFAKVWLAWCGILVGLWHMPALCIGKVFLDLVDS